MLVFFYTYEECDARCAAWDFLNDLLLSGAETGRVVRWDHGPSVVVVNGNALQKRMVGGAIFEINEVLAPTGIALRFARIGPPDITVEFVPHEELWRIAEAKEPTSGILGYAHGEATDDGRIAVAKVYVSKNLSEGETWGTLLHEFGHAMGVTGHTDRHLSSLFYADIKGGSRSDGYSREDRKMFRFLYEHLPPGADEEEIRAAFERHWIVE